uniref:NADH dehydrogenase subunit 6 n=1 Tax=Halocynthia roretzi TaxID=7729 RepID=Q9T9H7_HALRO|nr:NADH dehydrogenase subunit 6 [Halocynthia roretzi]BAA88253.1 NADH dehydrogenase subunit 6 [Halocynthia roretzi]
MGLDFFVLGMGICGFMVLFGGSFLVGILGLVLGALFLVFLMFFLNKVFFGLMVVLVYLGGMLLLFAFVASMLGLWKSGTVGSLSGVLMLGFGLLWFMSEGFIYPSENNLVFVMYLDGFMFCILGGFLLVLVLLMVLKASLGGSLVVE